MAVSLEILEIFLKIFEIVLFRNLKMKLILGGVCIVVIIIIILIAYFSLHHGGGGGGGGGSSNHTLKAN